MGRSGPLPSDPVGKQGAIPIPVKVDPPRHGRSDPADYIVYPHHLCFTSNAGHHKMSDRRAGLPVTSRQQRVGEVCPTFANFRMFGKAGEHQHEICDKHSIRFIGVSYGGITDYKGAMKNPDAAGRYSIAVSGKVTVFADTSALVAQNAQVGDIVYWDAKAADFVWSDGHRLFNPPALGSIKATDFRRSGGSSRSFSSIGSDAAHLLACGNKDKPSVINYIEALEQLQGTIDKKEDFDELVKYCATIPAPILDLRENKELNKSLNEMPNVFFFQDRLGIRKSKNLYCMLKKISDGDSVEAVATSLGDYEELDLNDAELATLKTIAGNEAKIVFDVEDILATLQDIKTYFDKFKDLGINPFGLFVLYTCAPNLTNVASDFSKFYIVEEPAEGLVETDQERTQRPVAAGEKTDVSITSQSSFDRLKTIATAMKMGAAEAAARHTADSFSTASGGRRNKRIRTGDTFTTKCDDADKSSRIIGTLIELGDWSGRKNECSILLDPRLSLM